MSRGKLTLEIAGKQVDEIQYLLKSSEYATPSAALTITSPKLFQRLSNCIKCDREPIGASKNLSLTLKLSYFDFSWGDALLEVTFPSAYPDCGLPHFYLRSQKLSDARINYCIQELEKYLEPFAGHCCLSSAFEYMIDNVESLLSSTMDSSETEVLEEGGENEHQQHHQEAVSFIRFNHLIKGPEHKKEKAMLDAAKKENLSGAIIWGTPGVMLIAYVDDDDDVLDYMRTCKTIGKRPDGPVVMRVTKEALECAGIGESGGKLAAIDTAGLRVLLGGNEDLLREVLGVSSR